MNSKPAIFLAVTILSAVSLGAAGAEGAEGAVGIKSTDEYEKIRKDITVMANIITGAFEADKSCERCDPNIETSYLANQGAVFTVRANSWRRFEAPVPGNHYSFVIPSPDETTAPIEISQIVNDAMAEATDALENIESRFEIFLGEEGMVHERHIRIDTGTRAGLRELGREIRELEYERREHEIELIHANEDERKNLEKAIAELQEQIDNLADKRDQLNAKLEAEKQTRATAQVKKRQAAEEDARKQLALFQSIVMQSFCDYGGTLRNLPRGEHVSVIFEQKNKDQNHIFVLERDDVIECRQGSNLKSKALNYLF